MTIKSFLLSLISGITLLTAAPTVFGETYNAPMQVLENGTNSASYASAYFANSATVTPNGNQYTVTSTVTTDTSLGDYPVQMLSIDGSGVTTSRSQSGNKQTITYSFVTSDLKARHNANIKVDVDSINYHHNYTVGLVLDTANVPAPAASVTSADSTAASTSVAAVASSQTTSHVAATSSSHETREATSSATQATTAESVTTNSATETSASSASASTSTAGKTDSEAHAATSSSAHKSTKAAKKSAPAQQKSADQTTDQAAALPVGLIIGVGLAIGILGALATVFLKRH